MAGRVRYRRAVLTSSLLLIDLGALGVDRVTELTRGTWRWAAGEGVIERHCDRRREAERTEDDRGD